MERRVHTEECECEGLESGFENYLDPKQLDCYHDSSNDAHGRSDDHEQEIDHNNYKGIYFDEDTDTKIQDPDTGAHFDYNAMCRKLREVEVEIRKSQEREQQLAKKTNEKLCYDQQDKSKHEAESSISSFLNRDEKKCAETILQYPYFHDLNSKIYKTSSDIKKSAVKSICLLPNKPSHKIANASMLGKQLVPKEVSNKHSEFVVIKNRDYDSLQNKGFNVTVGTKEKCIKQMNK